MLSLRNSAQTAFFILGSSPWLLVNAVFLQSEFYVAVLPEAKYINATIALLVTLSNVTPLLYVAYVQLVVFKRKGLNEASSSSSLLEIGDSRRQVRIDADRSAIGVLVWVLFVTAFVLSATWDTTATLGDGTRFSVGLTVCCFIAGCCGTLSIVTLFPYASNFSPACTTAVSSGMGFSALIGCVVAAIQGVSLPEPRFGPSVFFAIVGVLQLIAGLSYFAVRRYEAEWLQEAAEGQESSGDTGNPEEKESVTVSLRDSLTWTNVSPVLANYLTSTLNYFLHPSLYPFLVSAAHDHAAYAALMYLYFSANFLGRLSASRGGTLHGITRMWPMNVAQFVIIAYLTAVAVARTNESQTWVLIALIALFSALQGRTTTVVYFHIRFFNRADPSSASDWSRYCALANQAGSLTGTFIAAGLVFGGVFGPQG